MEYDVMKRYSLFFGLALFAILCISGCLPDDMDYRQNGDGTRTVTIGVTSESPATKAEIDDNVVFSWTNGDRIAVWSGNGTSGQYYTSDAYAGGNKYNVALSGVRSNYAVYPASIADGDNATSSSLKVNLPAEYDFRSTSADWSPLPMVATNIEGRNLEFKHLGGLLRVSVGYLPEGTSYVTVDLGKKINGSFPVHISNSGSYITADEATGGYTYTKFLVPSSGNVVLNLPVPTGTYNSVAVNAYNAAGTLLGSDTPTFSWTCNRAHGKKLTRDDFGWVYVFGTLSDGTVPYTGGDVSLASGFQSYRERGSEKETVPYVLQYRYSKNGVEDWYDEAPDWLTGAPASSAGSIGGENLTLSVAPQVNSAEDPHHDVLAARTPKTNFDLSTVNVATGATGSRTTANCYVVQAPGTYKFPLVYGNGVKNGAVNESAYRAKAGVDATEYRPDDGIQYYLGRFKDHLDQNIMSPYIAAQQSGKALSATLVWTDALGLVTDVALSGNGENTYLTFRVSAETITQGNALVAVLADGVIAWSWHIWVTEEDLTSVKEGSNGYLFAPVNVGWCDGNEEIYEARDCLVRATQNNSNHFVTGTLSQTKGIVTIFGNNPYYEWGRKDPIQASNGIATEPLGALEDPFCDKTYYPSSSEYTPIIDHGARRSLGEAIRTPYIYYVTSYPYSSPYDWCSTSYYNTWSSTMDAPDYSLSHNVNAKTKTIYDPSPAGFRVPSQDAYSDFTTSNFTIVPASGPMPGGRVYSPSGLFFPATGSRDGQRCVVNRYGSGGAYYSSLPYADIRRDCTAYGLSFSSSVTTTTASNRPIGRSVRPVVDN